MSKQTDGQSCGAFLAADIAYLIKYGKLATKEDYTNNDMPEFRKFMQLTVILARQIAPIEDYDDDVAFLVQDEMRLHDLNSISNTSTIDI